jgi:hypothetical protein
MTRLYARSSAEAHLYMDQQPCGCGASEFERHAAVIVDGDALCSRYAGPCRQCGRLREFVFVLPEALPPVTAQLAYGGSEPSRLLDPGEWLAVADADPPSARAAIEEVLKFLPEAADRVPDDAFHSARGRAVRDAGAERFRRDRLETALAELRDRDGDGDAPPSVGTPRRRGTSRSAAEIVAAAETAEPHPGAGSRVVPGAGARDAAADARDVPALIDELAAAVVHQEGFAGPELPRQAGDLAGQIRTLIRMYQIQAREELTRRESTAEIEQLIDSLARTATPIGAAIAAHRADIVDAFRRVGLAELGRGVQVLMQWMRDPAAGRAPVEQLLAELRATLGTDELAEADASQRRVEQAVRGALGMFGQARPR